MKRNVRRVLILLAALVAGGLVASGCADTEVKGEYPKPRQRGDSAPVYTERESIFGEGGLNLGGGGKPKDADTGIGVNGYLWRASLDTVSFMPVNSADPFGGVIITDWHAMPEAPGERFKMNIYILGRSLRADGVKVAVFRQVRDSGGGWQDAAVPEAAAINIEDAILTRARQLRFDTAQP